MFNYLVNYFKALVPQKSKKGQAVVEYALIIALIAVVCIGGITIVGTNANTLFGSIAGSLK